MEALNMVEKIYAIVARIRGMALAPDVETTRITEAIASLPGMQTTDDVHRFREWVVEVGWGSPSQREFDMLARVKPLQLTSAPEVAALIDTAEGYVIMRRYWACPGETFARVEGSAVRFSKQASARFRTEIERLIDAGLYHAYARGFYHWWVAQPSGTIVLDSWFALQPCKERDRAEQLDLIDRRLEERAAT